MLPLICEPRALAPPSNALLVDDCDCPGGALVIDHHVNHTTPQNFARGRTATERVLNAIEDGLLSGSFSAAVIRHYDADGVLAIWALQNPKAAREARDTLITAAEYGDFFETPRRDPHRAGLRLALAVQEAQARELTPSWAARLSPRRALWERFDHGLAQIASVLAGEKLSIHVDGLLRQIDEEACCLRLVDAPVPVLGLKRGATLHAIMAVTSDPVVALAAPAVETGRLRYSIVLRPIYGWGYAEDAVGSVALRSLEGLADQLSHVESSHLRSICRWDAQRFDASVWRLDTSPRGSRMAPEFLAAEIGTWLAERLRAAQSASRTAQ